MCYSVSIVVTFFDVSLLYNMACGRTAGFVFFCLALCHLLWTIWPLVNKENHDIDYMPFFFWLSIHIIKFYKNWVCTLYFKVKIDLSAAVDNMLSLKQVLAFLSVCAFVCANLHNGWTYLDVVFIDVVSFKSLDKWKRFVKFNIWHIAQLISDTLHS